MKTLAAIAAHTRSALSREADGSIAVTRVSALGNAGPDALVFIENASSLEAAIASGAGAIVAPLSTQASSTPLLLADHPRLVFAQAAKYLRHSAVPHRIHPSAIVEHPEKLGSNVSIGPHATIGDAIIGDQSIIGAGCNVPDSVTIGKNCHLHPNVTIYPSTSIGDRVVVHAGAVLGADGFGYVRDPRTGEYLQFPQQGALVIEDDVEIGANTTIDRGALEETRIGRGTKLDNLVHIGHNVRIGRHVVIASQTGISGSCTLGDGAILGGQVGMGDHVTIGEDVILGGGSGILPHKNLRGPHQVFWGTPAKPLKQYLRELATLGRLSRRAADREPASDRKQEGK